MKGSQFFLAFCVCALNLTQNFELICKNNLQKEMSHASPIFLTYFSSFNSEDPIDNSVCLLPREEAGHHLS